MFNPIVVPLDGSVLAERALVPARALAQYTHARLLLARVVVPERMLVAVDAGFGVSYLDQALIDERQEAERYLGQLRATLANEAVEVRVDTRPGDVAGTLVEDAQQAQAGLIVMSSHGYSGVRRLVLGSVAEKVLGAAPCPVWVVRAPNLPKHMLIPLDGSRLAEEVLVPALTLARCFGTEVTLLRVVPEVSVEETRKLDGSERGLGQRFVDEIIETAADYLAQTADRLDDGVAQVHTAIRSGPPAEAILDYAERHSVDLVAMTTHGRTGLRRLIYGSVMQKVLDELPASMLVVRSTSAEWN